MIRIFASGVWLLRNTMYDCSPFCLSGCMVKVHAGDARTCLSYAFPKMLSSTMLRYHLTKFVFIQVKPVVTLDDLGY